MKKLSLSPAGALRFCLLFAFVLYLWNFFRSYFLFLALVLILLGPAVSFLLLQGARASLGIGAQLPDNKVGRNTEFMLLIKVQNPRRFSVFTADVTYCFCNVFTGYTERKKQHIWVAPGSGSTIEEHLLSRYAGRVEVRIESFEVFDLLHLFRLRDCERSNAYAVVWPSFSGAADQELSGCVDNFPKEDETRKRGTDYNPDYEVREYIPGDELKNIHWKLSAKQEQLMVRQRLAAGREKINVLLPLSDDKQRNDALVESLYALCLLLLKNAYPIQLYRPGRGGVLQGSFIAEQGELEHALEETLSDSGLHRPGEAEAQMAMEHSGESYILVQTGANKGAYIQ